MGCVFGIVAFETVYRRVALTSGNVFQGYEEWVLRSFSLKDRTCVLTDVKYLREPIGFLKS
jgi:hypothetical protein